MAEVINGLLLLLRYLTLEMFSQGALVEKNICTNKLLVLPALPPNVFLICQIRKGVNVGKEMTLPRKSLSSSWYQGQVVFLSPSPLLPLSWYTWSGKANGARMEPAKQMQIVTIVRDFYSIRIC